MNTTGIIIWASIVVVSGILCFVGYKILVKDWYANRKLEVKWGFLSCFFSVSFFLFAPLVTMGKKIDLIVAALHNLISQGNEKQVETGFFDSGLDEEMIATLSKTLGSAIRSFIKIPDLSSPKVQITIASVGALLIVVVALVLIHLIKEEKTKFKENNNRKHLFEIQESAYAELTKKRG